MDERTDLLNMMIFRGSLRLVRFKTKLQLIRSFCDVTQLEVILTLVICSVFGRVSFFTTNMYRTGFKSRNYKTEYSFEVFFPTLGLPPLIAQPVVVSVKCTG